MSWAKQTLCGWIGAVVIVAGLAGCAARRCAICDGAQRGTTRVGCRPKCGLAVDPICHGYRPTRWNAWPACCPPCPPPDRVTVGPEAVRTPTGSPTVQQVPGEVLAVPMGQPRPAANSVPGPQPAPMPEPVPTLEAPQRSLPPSPDTTNHRSRRTQAESASVQGVPGGAGSASAVSLVGFQTDADEGLRIVRPQEARPECLPINFRMGLLCQHPSPLPQTTAGEEDSGELTGAAVAATDFWATRIATDTEVSLTARLVPDALPARILSEADRPEPKLVVLPPPPRDRGSVASR